MPSCSKSGVLGVQVREEDSKEDDARVSEDAEKPIGDITEARHTINSSIGKRPPCFGSTLHEVSFVLLATVAMGTATFLTGATVVIAASVSDDLAMNQSQVTWISASATLIAGAFQLALGQLADLLGRRLFFVTGMALFSGGCLVIAFAQTPLWINALCGVLGFCSAMIVPPAIGILGAAYSKPSKRKNWAFACFSAGNPLGFAFGSIVSGVASRVFNWRVGFVFLAAVWAILAVVSFKVVPSVEAFEPAPLGARVKQALTKFDSLGTALTVVGVGMLTAALTLGPVDGWRSAHVIAMLVIGMLLTISFIFWERQCAHPLMPLQVWKDRTFSLLVTITILGMMGFMSSNFWLALLLQEVRNQDALDVAVCFLPQVIAGIIWNIVAANVLHWANNTVIVAGGAVAYVISSLLLALQGASSSYWAFMFPSLIISVIGADFQFNIANMYVTKALPSPQQGTAGGILITLIRLGGTIALGISTAVYSSADQTQSPQDDPIVPYQSAFYVSVGLASLSLLFVPFLRVGTRGNM